LMPFAAARGLAAAEVVNSSAGVRVDHAKRRWLAAQIVENPAEHDVLEDIGETAGVKGMTIVHRIEIRFTAVRLPPRVTICQIAAIRACHSRTTGARGQRSVPRRPNSLRGVVRVIGRIRMRTRHAANENGSRHADAALRRMRLAPARTSCTTTNVTAASPIPCKANGNGCGADRPHAECEATRLSHNDKTPFIATPWPHAIRSRRTT